MSGYITIPALELVPQDGSKLVITGIYKSAHDAIASGKPINQAVKYTFDGAILKSNLISAVEQDGTIALSCPLGDATLAYVIESDDSVSLMFQ